MKNKVKRTIGDIIRIDTLPGASAKGLFPVTCNKEDINN